jgi:hypothetical protein
MDVKQAVVEAARQWPLYFSRFYEVIEERGNEDVQVLLAVGESGIRICSRNYSSELEPLKIIDHFECVTFTLEIEDI